MKRHSTTGNKSNFIFYWNIWIALLATYIAIEIPFELTLHYKPGWIILFFNWMVTACFITDIFIRFREPADHNGNLVYDRKFISKNYLKGWFSIDLLSAIPFELLFWINGDSFLVAFFVSLRTLKVLRILSFKTAWEYKVRLKPGIVRLSVFFYFLMISMHWISCGWIDIRPAAPGADMVQEYVKALYWCVSTVTTIGYGDITPDKKRNIEMIYTMSVQLTGAGAYGFIIGNIATLLTNIDIAKTRHRERVDRINNFMKSKKMPQKLQERVHHYYNYLWSTRRGYDDAVILSELPVSFRYEFALLLNKGIIEKVPMFKDIDPILLKEIVFYLTPCIYAPGDAIFTFGEIGDKMFFINKGMVEVISGDGKHVYAVLKEGDFFGEIALLLKQPRNATVCAIEYCDLYSLSKESFDRVISNYPDFEKNIQKMAQERMNKLN